MWFAGSFTLWGSEHEYLCLLCLLFDYSPDYCGTRVIVLSFYKSSFVDYYFVCMIGMTIYFGFVVALLMCIGMLFGFWVVEVTLLGYRLFLGFVLMLS